MRDTFLEYYQPDFKSLWDKSLFVFDANVLLNLYRYSEKTREDFFRVINAKKDRVWIPYQFAKEYHENRLEVIQSQQSAYDRINELLNSHLETLRSELAQFQKHVLIDINEITANFAKSVDTGRSHVKACKEKHPNWSTVDPILEKITSIFTGGAVGKPYTAEKMLSIEKIGAERYSKKIPPGFADSKKSSDRKYGDLIGWLQIMDKAKESNMPIILVTGDQKEDWWRKQNGQIHGPHVALKREIWDFSNVEFHMYSPERFMEFASKSRDIKLDPKTLEEVKSLSGVTLGEILAQAIRTSLGEQVTSYQDAIRAAAGPAFANTAVGGVVAATTGGGEILASPSKSEPSAGSQGVSSEEVNK